MLRPAIIALITFSSGVLAMMRQNESWDSILESTHSIVIVEVKSVSKERETKFHRTLDFTAIPLKVIDGDVNVASPLALRYSEGRLHSSGDIPVTPLGRA